MFQIEFFMTEKTGQDQLHRAKLEFNEILTWLKYLRRILSFYMQQR